MFIEQYRLERNPFARERVRSVFASHSFQHAAARVAQVLRGRIHCLYLTGVAGVGKTTLVEAQLARGGSVAIGRVPPHSRSAAVVLRALIRELGLGDIEGSESELRRILEVYLTHQASLGRRSLIFADAIESDSPAVLQEIEALLALRLRGLPVVHGVLTTRNEALVRSLMSRHDGSSLAPALHQRLLGLTLEETAAYLRSCVEGAGCDWYHELFAEELLVEIQSFTQGVVADIDALCCGALELLAAGAKTGQPLPRLSMALLKATAGKLHLKYDARAWRAQHREVLEPGAVRLSSPEGLRIDAARLTVTSGGRPIAEVSLDRPRMVLGRDPSCDIALDSSYVSRYQNLFMETRDGWMLIDLDSANGCYVNGRRVRAHRLRDGDLISLGQHQLRFSGLRNVTDVPAEPVGSESDSRAGRNLPH